MKKYRITYKKMEKVIFTTIAMCKSMRGAVQKARNLEPHEWDVRTITDLNTEWNLKLDKIEYET